MILSFLGVTTAPIFYSLNSAVYTAQLMEKDCSKKLKFLLFQLKITIKDEKNESVEK